MRGRLLRVAALVAVLLVCVRRASACIWDSDTLATEAEGLPGVLDILTGRFDRMPPLYFEMRLARAEKAVAANADDLGAYDDAGVACDRLGRDDDALAWMERKSARLGAMGGRAPKEHRYRHLANRGTFRAHRWFASGADRARIDELRAARDDIAEAIRIEPDAHFGRERYQLAAMTFIADPPGPSQVESYPARDFVGLAELGGMETRANDRLEKAGYGDAIQGLCGLVVLGAAWESVDVFHAIANAAQVDGRSSVAYVADLRVAELIAAGRRSFDPSHPADAAALSKRLADGPRFVEGGPAAEVRDWFTRARADADRWVAARRAFAEAKLREGRAPDNVPEFWAGFELVAPEAAPVAPILPSEVEIPGLGRRETRSVILVVLACLGGAAGLFVVFRVVDGKRRKSRRQRMTSTGTSGSAARN